MPNLSILIFQDLIGKWEKYVTDHDQYRECYLEFTQWASDAKEKLDACRSSEIGSEQPSESSSLEVTCEMMYYRHL